MQDSAAILLAAGRGTRMRGVVDDKTLARLSGRPVFWYSLRAFVEAGIVGRFVVVFRDAQQRAQLLKVFEKSPAREWPIKWVRGGRERLDSVANALNALPAGIEYVHIHDCARPLIRPEALRTLDQCLRRDGAACLAHRIADTIKRLPAGAGDPVRRRLRTLDRERLWGMETPQSFRRAVIAEAYREVKRRGLHITDDAAALELATKHRVTLLENTAPNPKITRPADLAYAEFLLANAANPS